MVSDTDVPPIRRCGKTFRHTCAGEPPRGWGDLGTGLDFPACRKKCKFGKPHCSFVTFDSTGQCTSWQTCKKVANASTRFVWKNCKTTKTTKTTTTTRLDDHGDTIADATTIQLGNPVHAKLELPGDVDYFCFDVMSAGIYKFDAILTEESARLDLDVYTSSGDFLGSNRFNDGQPRLGLMIEQSGTYCVNVSAFDSTSTPSYDILVKSSFDDHGDSAANATEIELGTLMRGEIDYFGDADFFCISLQPGFYSFETNLPDHDLLLRIAKEQDHGDTTITLYDSDGDELDYNDDGDYEYYDQEQFASRLRYRVTTEGTYCIKVAAFEDDNNPVYEVLVQ
eukprot:CAMPEP_0170592722 /NCGR_PEP_ID=MMETSP0224-20130122/13073_1 /TAXON_ID=285029 /ORGANISM="Togula jolla, Strain CCCM 725" /LENGTH=337 /DNA_ID=CAMNT_0010916641 /DNA_START=167 /DNA_END=1180 /DNA_ORIENTATION=+